MEKIFLNKHRSKQSVNDENILGVELKNSKNIIPQDNFFSTINLVDVYNDERYNCSKIRLNCVIRPYCTNVLFNPFTEIVKNEGSDDAVCLNYTSVSDCSKMYSDIVIRYKTKDNFETSSNSKFSSVQDAYRVYNLIEDTQLSSKNHGNLIYHCGLDFFNNHILRSLTFKRVNVMSQDGISPEFNTMLDYHRDYNGKIVKEDTVRVGGRDFSNFGYKMHIYTFDDILSFNDCVKQKLKEENGWFGFVNKSQLKTFDKNYNEILDISKPLNNRESCDFVDMYPDRSLFYFTPKYNEFRNRIEKNWNYLITFPYSSTTLNIPFITDNGNLRLFLVNETYHSEFKMFSMSKHGLKSGDYINLYRDDKKLFDGLTVTKIEDDYVFYTNKNGYTIDSKYEIEANNQHKDVNGTTSYKFKKNDLFYYDTNSNFLTFSFRKVVESKEVDYYVKILTKLPNWKFPKEQISEKLIYDTWGGVESEDFKYYQKNNTVNDDKIENNEEPFENHISKLSFSKNIYNDDISEIIFTDDIDINYLHDNLNRPLSSIFLTVIKNNKGYKKWYIDNNVGSSEVEFSHCFGPVTCGFYLNPLMYDTHMYNKDIYNLSNSRTLHYLPPKSIDGEEPPQEYSGLTSLNDNTDEITISNNMFYGDLYSYSHETCEEELIQKIDARFNTYQREYNGVKNKNINKRLNYSNIIADDYDLNGAWNDLGGGTNVQDFIECKTLDIGNLPEGYFYQQNYEIPIRTVSVDLQTQIPKSFSIRKIEKEKENFKVFTNETNFLELGDKILFYEKHHDNVNENVTAFKVIEVINHREFICEINENEEVKSDFDPITNKRYFRIIKIDKTVPNHAEILLDGSCRIVWRDILQNGFDKTNGSSIERYPFTNGRFYVMKDFNFYLRRQNPYNNNVLTKLSYDDYKIDGHFIDTDEINNYYNEKDIRC